MPEAVPIVEIMQEYAEKAVAQAGRCGVTLDYSEQSLLAVDGLLTRMTAGGLIRPDSLTAEERENLDCLCNAYGGYLGEVIVRHIGAVWLSEDSDDGRSFAVKLKVRDRLRGSPPNRIWKRLTQCEFDTIISYYRGLQHVLGLKPFVPAQFKKPWYRRLLG